MGQMSLWGVILAPQMIIYLILTTPNKKIDSVWDCLWFITPFNIQKGARLRGADRIGPHDRIILEIIFGSLLGDGHLERRKGGAGSRLSLFQESSHVEYILYLHQILADWGYCNPQSPQIKKRLGTKGKIIKVVRFHTWTYTSWNWIHDLWYIDDIKHIPQNVGDFLTPIALAIWIMDNGGRVSSGLKLATNGFNFQECQLLTNVLYSNFKLKASVISAGVADQYCIYIWKESMEDLRRIVSPFIIKEMTYKIN